MKSLTGDALFLCGPIAAANQRIYDVFGDMVREHPDHWLGWIYPWAEPARIRQPRLREPARAQLAAARAG